MQIVIVITVIMADHNLVVIIVTITMMKDHDLVVFIVVITVMNLDHLSVMVPIAVPVLVADADGYAACLGNHHRLVACCRSGQRGSAQDCKRAGDKS
jgi:hypothetical protein